MAAPVAAFVQLPTDSGNTGKKVRTQTRVVGSDTVHEHFFIPISQRGKTGVYSFTSGVLAVQAAAQNGTTTGFLWLQNPAGSTVKAAIRRLNVQSQFTTSLSTPTAPRIQFNLFTFTGTASGASITPAKVDSAQAANQVILRSASTGMTVTLGAAMWASFPFVVAGTAGLIFGNAAQAEMIPQDEDGYTVLRTGEGVVCWQADAGTTADTRKWIVNGGWEEYE